MCGQRSLTKQNQLPSHGCFAFSFHAPWARLKTKAPRTRSTPKFGRVVILECWDLSQLSLSLWRGLNGNRMRSRCSGTDTVLGCAIRAIACTASTDGKAGARIMCGQRWLTKPKSPSAQGCFAFSFHVPWARLKKKAPRTRSTPKFAVVWSAGTCPSFHFPCGVVKRKSDATKFL